MRLLVILASYNGEKYIREQIDSILNQENVDLDIFVFDDCSKDKTVEIINSYDEESRVKLVKNASPQGSAASNFFGAIKYFSAEELQKYKYIAFSDQDDIWLLNKLSRATDFLKNDRSELYMSNLIVWEEKTNNKTILKKSFSQKKYDFLFEGGSAGCTYVFTSLFALELKTYLNEVNYNNWKFFSHDWFVYFFARLKNYKVSIDKEAYILYRIHDSNVHGQLNTISLHAIKERLKLIKEGWYFQQIRGFAELVPDNSEYKRIYNLYSKNYFTRFYVILRYNFQLIRSSSKMIQFAFISLLPIKIKKV